MSIYLKPDATYTWNGVKVNYYYMTEHNPNKISLPPKRSGDIIGVTVHNTNRINVSSKTTPAEQYLRATINGNMNTVRVHLYVDSECAWLCLPFDYSSWHAGQSGKADRNGSEKGNGNTISVEVIMDGSGDEEDIKARDNAARIIAYILEFHNGVLYTHNYWCNIRNGRKGTVDELNKLSDGYKGCPIYLRSEWDDFTALVNSYRFENSAVYYVQVGAFRSKSNAEAFLLSVKKDYPNAFIKTM